MSKRHSDAIAIQCGACNPRAIVNSIIKALDEIRDGADYQGTASYTKDEAVRLMVHQLAFLCGVFEIDNDQSVYNDLIRICEADGYNEPSGVASD